MTYSCPTEERPLRPSDRTGRKLRELLRFSGLHQSEHPLNISQAIGQAQQYAIVRIELKSNVTNKQSRQKASPLAQNEDGLSYRMF